MKFYLLIQISSHYDSNKWLLHIHFMNLKKIYVLLSWQLSSLILCGAGSMCTLISIKYEKTIPFFMVSITYCIIFLCFVWGAPKSQIPWWKSILIAVATIAGDYSGVMAYSKTSFASALVLCTTTIFWVVPIGYFVFGRKINLIQLFAIILGVSGGAMILISDGIKGNSWLGDVLALVSAICYSIGTTLQEYLVHNDTTHSYLFRFSASASPIAIICSAAIEWKTIRDYDWEWLSLGLILIYSILLSLYDIISPYIMQYSDATTMNLSLLTSNFYSLGISILAFGLKFSWLYIVGFFCIPAAIAIFTLSEKEEQKEDSTMLSFSELK